MNTRAFAIPAVVWVIAALGGAAMVAVPNFRPANWFSKDKVAEANAALQSAQADVAKAKSEAIAAQVALQALRDTELAKKDAQLGYAQQMAVGASESLKQATPEPAVKLAISLLDRTNTGLAAAIGALPPDKQQEIVRLVAQSLSGMADQLAAANATLAQKDRELAVITTERTEAKAQIPKLETALKAKEEALAEKTAVVATKTDQLVAQAEKIAAKEREAGSLASQVNNLGRLLIVICLIYVVAHWLLPSLAQEFPAFKLLGTLNRTVKSVTSAHS